MNLKLGNSVRFAASGILLVAATQAQAVTESVNATAEFVSPLAISAVSDMSFGLISTDMVATNTIVISTADAVTDANSLIVGGTQAAASMTVAATAGQTLDILVDNPSTPTGYTLGSFTCKYATDSETACSTSISVTAIASAALKVGATLTGNGLDVVGADNATFDVTLTYQ